MFLEWIPCYACYQLVLLSLANTIIYFITIFNCVHFSVVQGFVIMRNGALTLTGGMMCFACLRAMAAVFLDRGGYGLWLPAVKPSDPSRCNWACVCSSV